jgi:hypothetical protein
MVDSSTPVEPSVEPGGARTWPQIDRRARSERRAQPTRFWDSLLGRRRRAEGRRIGESGDVYVDRFGRGDVMLVLGIFALNIFDAFCTLVWLRRGGSEGNPLMDLAIQAGDSVFLFQKCIVAGLWLLVLLVHKNFRIARIGLWVLLGVYGTLAAYHGFLALFADPEVAGPIVRPR